ncbi:MAG: glutathione S-transferase family protein [Bdellovibrionales bacterium]|nr:glutathione S-transferase family protein [Bdellovibrionales bacterium]
MMTDKIKFYYNPMSRGRIAHWMLEEVEADYEIKSLNWETRDNKSTEYLKINPMGKIPAMEHKGIVVTENAAICAYLADLFPQSRLAPPIGDPKRGSYYRWLFFTASCLEPAMLDKTHPRTDSPSSSQLGHGSYDDVVNTLEQAVSNGFLIGDHFTAADLYLASNIEWYIFTKALDAKPVFSEYVKKCQDRPGYKRFIDQVGSFD